MMTTSRAMRRMTTTRKLSSVSCSPVSPVVQRPTPRPSCLSPENPSTGCLQLAVTTGFVLHAAAAKRPRRGAAQDEEEEEDDDEDDE